MNEELQAVFVTYPNGEGEAKFCATCYKQHSKDIEQNFAFIFLVYGNEGIPVTNEGCEKVFGKICDDCHSPLGAWYVCKWCDTVQWFDDTHTCPAFPLSDDQMDDLDWQQTEFEEDVL